MWPGGRLGGCVYYISSRLMHTAWTTVLGNDTYPPALSPVTAFRSPVLSLFLAPAQLRVSLSHLSITCLCIAVTPACPSLSSQDGTGVSSMCLDGLSALLY